MFWSRTFIPTLKEAPQEAESISHQLMLRAGIIRMLIAGVYSYLPLGLKVLNNINKIIRQELDRCAAHELLLPALQPLELWQKSGRDAQIGEVMIRFTDRKGRKLCLGPTHEEVITQLVKSGVFSYKQLPLVLYQIQTKFRDEIRPRFGVVRACEFMMQDAYSFDRDEAGLEKNYQLIFAAYQRIFARCGLNYLALEADPGVMGGDISHEFMVPAESGEDVVLSCSDCQLSIAFKEDSEKAKPVCPACKKDLKKINTIEIGHIFKLGAKYSQILGANYLDRDGKLKPLIMGCYGIGVSRMVAAVIEQNHDKDGIIWPRELSPYQVVITPLDFTEEKIKDAALEIYRQLSGNEPEILLDDRNEQAGVKFKDADLIGVPLQIIISRELLRDGSLEMKLRGDKKSVIGKKTEILEKIKKLIHG